MQYHIIQYIFIYMTMRVFALSIKDYIFRYGKRSYMNVYVSACMFMCVCVCMCVCLCVLVFANKFQVF